MGTLTLLSISTVVLFNCLVFFAIRLASIIQVLKYAIDALLAQTDSDAKIQIDVDSMKIITKEAMSTAISLIKYNAIQQHIFLPVI